MINMTPGKMEEVIGEGGLLHNPMRDDIPIKMEMMKTYLWSWVDGSRLKADQLSFRQPARWVLKDTQASHQRSFAEHLYTSKTWDSLRTRYV
jgi:hypothetical protein